MVSAAQTLSATNREKYELIKDGVQVTFRNVKGERVHQCLRVFDFNKAINNDFFCVRELWVRGDLYRRRADIVGFVNGLPLLFIEFDYILENPPFSGSQGDAKRSLRIEKGDKYVLFLAHAVRSLRPGGIASTTATA